MCLKRMMKLNSAGLLLAGVLFSMNSIFGSTEENLIKNHGFETAKPGTNAPEDWVVQEWTGDSHGKVRVELSQYSHSGKYSAGVTWLSGDYNVLLLQTITNVKGGHSFRLKYYFKTKTKSAIFSTIRTENAVGKELQYLNSRIYEIAGDELTPAIQEFTTHPETDRLIIYLRSGKEPVWYDDVSLEEIDPKDVKQGEHKSVGLAAWYDFSGAQGETLPDKSGNQNNGKAYGGEFVRHNDAYALKLNGEKDYVEFKNTLSLDIGDALTIETWLWIDKDTPAFGDRGIIGKGYGSYVLTYYKNRKINFYISGGGNSVESSIVTPETWHHVAATFDGKMKKMYVDGLLEDENLSKADRINQGYKLYIGRSDGDTLWTKDAHFKGMIAEAKIYDKALTAQEIKECFASSREKFLSRQVKVKTYLSYREKEIGVELDFTGLSEAPHSVKIDLLKSKSENATASREMKLTGGAKKADAVLKLDHPEPGEYLLQARAFNKDGELIGKVSRETILWPAKPAWKGCEKNTQVLNNFVTELLSIGPGNTEACRKYQFVNPRNGWVYIRADAKHGEAEKFSVILDAASKEEAIIVFDGGKESETESMQYLKEGKHEITVWSDGKLAIDKLVVRAMPEIILIENQDVVLRRNPGMLKEINVILESSGRDQQNPKTENLGSAKSRLDEWRKRGRKALMISSAVPGGRSGQLLPAESYSLAYEYWTTSAGFQYLDGIAADEFDHESREGALILADAIRKLRANEQFKDKLFYAYHSFNGWVDNKDSRPFQKAIMDCGYIFAPEVYLCEQPDEISARKVMERMLRQDGLRWEKAFPDSMPQRVVVLGLGTMTVLHFNINTCPNVDYKVWLDMQFNLLANDPVFFGLRGISAWIARYADEETLRWMSALYRHYGIEGKTDMLSREYGYTYVLPHIQNPDFAEGLKGWDCVPGEGGRIEIGKMTGFSLFSGRIWYGGGKDYAQGKEGDTFLLMKRKGRNPNIVSQEIKKLQLGKLYSVKMITADYSDISKGISAEKANMAKIQIENAELVDEKCFIEKFRNYHAMLPCFDEGKTGKRKGWLNYHYKVFCAKSDAAKLIITDLTDGADGAVDQELMINFIEVQPYFAD